MTFPSLFTRALLVAATCAASAAPPPPNFQPNPRRLNPPPGIVVPPEVRRELTAGVEKLDEEIRELEASLRAKPELQPLLPDVEIYPQAVRAALLDDIFTSSNQFPAARALLQQGHLRARQLAQGQAPWNTKSGLLALKQELEAAAKAGATTNLTHVPVIRGYRSRVDGSVQPYGLLVPARYLQGDDRPGRLDFWLHGRGDTLNEIAFIEGRQRPGSEFLPDDAFVLHPYGRFMNAFKFAGETDVFESWENAARHFPIDRTRVAMRGFSMGGAGAWHLGAHHAGRFAAVNPGAGFVDVLNYQKLAPRLSSIPWWEQKLWALYDPLACPLNLTDTTLIAYSGAEDAQKAAADLMEAALLKEGHRMTHIIAPKTGHRYEPEARKEVARLVDQALSAKREPMPRKLTWVTHTLQFHHVHWLTVDALEEHWKEARIDAEVVSEGPSARVVITTRNVRELSVSFTPASLVNRGARLVIDGQELPYRPTVFSNPPPGQPASWWNYSATKTAGKWAERSPYADTRLAKKHGLQGPIDHAFMDSFLMVRPTGKPLNDAVGRWVSAELSEALFHWQRFFRGAPRVKDDREVTEADIKNHHLVLWGDPMSNAVYAKLADRLPIRWTQERISVGEKTYDASQHVPVLVYPNPLNPNRYIVINTGFTFPHQAAESNSLQTPKLPDWAILDLRVPFAERVEGKGILAANFFGEFWEVKPMPGQARTGE